LVQRFETFVRGASADSTKQVTLDIERYLTAHSSRIHIGLIRRPASSTTTNRPISTWPVSMSTRDDRNMAGVREGAVGVLGRHGR